MHCSVSARWPLRTNHTSKLSELVSEGRVTTPNRATSCKLVILLTDLHRMLSRYPVYSDMGRSDLHARWFTTLFASTQPRC